jgi:anion-transporting  ArsA/GET3 family ATPase
MASRTTRRPTREPADSLEALLSSKEIVIACGSGGVGKTTTAAAAAAMAAVHHGGRVLVLTVDPARRLADALGFSGGLGREGFGNEAKRVPAAAFSAAGVEPRGELWAAMLDTKQSWDALVRRHAPDKQTAARILENPLYQNIAGKFVQSHDYIAMERLYELHSEGRYDLIVVDTPPTRNALDFIEAPQRMAEFFSSRLLRLLIVPYRNRFVNLASRPFYQVADRILGSQFLADIAEFFILFQTMYDGFVQRAKAVERLLEDRRTTFVVVSTLEAAAVREAEFFIQVLAASTGCCPTTCATRRPDAPPRPWSPTPPASPPAWSTGSSSATWTWPSWSGSSSRSVTTSATSGSSPAPRRASGRSSPPCPTWWRPSPNLTPISTTWPACSGWVRGSGAEGQRWPPSPS